MKVKLARNAGFCMGVRRAMEIVLTEANKNDGPIYTYGPLIHNRQVMDLLSSKGVHSLTNLGELKSGTIVIRAHGIPPQSRKKIREMGLRVVDATCPRVAKVQAIIRSYTRKGHSAIIVGDPDHAEVIGLMGYSETPADVIRDIEEVSGLPRLDRPFVVAQTTQNAKKYDEIIHALKTRFPDLLVFNTICDATQQRQEEVRSIAQNVDAMVVVGGYHSGNTQRLAELSREVGLPTFHVETEKDLKKEELSSMEKIGVTAGASTPNWMINNVVKEIEGIKGRTRGSFSLTFKEVCKFLLLSNLLVASGAFGLTLAASILFFRPPLIAFSLLSFLYIHAMHVLNHFLDKGASAYNDPEKAFYLEKYRNPLIISATVSILIALFVSFHIGINTFLAIAGLTLLGALYSMPLFPIRFRGKYRYVKIKDIPGSRSLSEAIAWTAVISVLPFLESEIIQWNAMLLSIFVVFLMSYVRSALFDIFQAQGDLIVGTETLPVTLGEEKTLRLLKIILILTAATLALGPLTGLVGGFSYVMLLPIITLSACLLAYERHWIYPGNALETLIEANFIFSGIIALIWRFFR